MLYFHRLRDDIAHPHALIQAGIRILKYDLPHRLQHFPVGAKSRPGAGINTPVQNPAPRLINIHNTAGHRRFSGTRFPHQAEDLPSFYPKRNIVNRRDSTFLIRQKRMRKVLYIQQDLVRCFTARVRMQFFSLVPVLIPALLFSRFLNAGRSFLRKNVYRQSNRRCDLRRSFVQQPRRRIVGVADAEHRRLLFIVDGQRIRITAGKSVSLRRIDQRRRHPRNGIKRLPVLRK